MVEMSVLWLRRSAFLALMAAFAFGADPANVSELRRGFERPPNEARMMVRWWWFGMLVNRSLRMAMTYVMHPFRPRFSLIAWRALVGYSALRRRGDAMSG